MKEPKATDLTKLRKEIDTIDHEIIRLLNERVRCACDIGRVKEQSGASVYDPAREEEVFQRLGSINPGPLDNAAIRAIYREVISAARALQRKTAVGYLGPEATYTHQAALKNFGGSAEFLSFATVPDVFQAVLRDDVDFGVVPIENSTQGTVIATLDMLVESDLKIVAQIYLPILHCLISRSPLEEIREVHSKDNALGQCRQWLGRMLPAAELVESASTAQAVRHAAEHPGVAAIASRIAADLYEVPVVKENIQDKSENITRFLVIGKQPTPRLREGRDKTSLVFTLLGDPGTLMRSISSFSSRGINMVKIESRPSRQKLWDYLFFIDIVGHYEDAPVREAFEDLRRLCPFVKWLGSYPDVGL